MWTERLLLWPATLFLIVLAVAVVSLKNRTIRVSAIGAILAVQSLGAMRYYADFRKEPMDQVAGFLAQRMKAGDLLLWAPFHIGGTLNYYLGPHPSIVTLGVNPAATARSMPIRADIVAEVLPVNDALEEAYHHQRVWLVCRQCEGKAEYRQLIDGVADHLHRVEYQSFDATRPSYEYHIEVFGYERAP